MLNKTPNVSPAKTASVLRDILHSRAFSNWSLKDIFLTISMILLLVVMFGIFFRADTEKPISNQFCLRTEPITNGGKSTPLGTQHCILNLEEVRTVAEQAKGLSGRSDLAPNEGMLFIIKPVSTECMWMKDMKFSLDIAWLDLSGTVLKLEKNVSPVTYPQQYCAENSAFVIEVKAGVAEAEGIIPGAHFSF